MRSILAALLPEGARIGQKSAEALCWKQAVELLYYLQLFGIPNYYLACSRKLCCQAQ